MLVVAVAHVEGLPNIPTVENYLVDELMTVVTDVPGALVNAHKKHAGIYLVSFRTVLLTQQSRPPGQELCSETPEAPPVPVRSSDILRHGWKMPRLAAHSRHCSASSHLPSSCI